MALITGCISVGKIGQAEVNIIKTALCQLTPLLSQVYRITGVKMCSLRGYQPDEERVVEITKLLTSGAAYFSWSHQGPSHTIDLTMAAQKVHRYKVLQNVLLTESADAGSPISLTIGSSGTACCTSPM